MWLCTGVLWKYSLQFFKLVCDSCCRLTNTYCTLQRCACKYVLVTDWSILYVIIVLFTGVLGAGMVVWGVLCICQRWVDVTASLTFVSTLYYQQYCPQVIRWYLNYSEVKFLVVIPWGNSFTDQWEIWNGRADHRSAVQYHISPWSIKGWCTGPKDPTHC